jgi:hypothetical protein
LRQDLEGVARRLAGRVTTGVLQDTGCDATKQLVQL